MVLNALYRWCFNGYGKFAEKNPQKIVKTACNFQKTVYSMSSYREFHQPQATKEFYNVYHVLHHADCTDCRDD